MPHWFLILPHSSICLLLGMSHEPKSPSLGMISTATRTTATVSPLTPSPLNGSIVANGSPATQSAHSGFAAALRKLAKQAEEPRGKTRQLIWWLIGCIPLLLFFFSACENISNCYEIAHNRTLLKLHPTTESLLFTFYFSICSSVVLYYISLLHYPTVDWYQPNIELVCFPGDSETKKSHSSWLINARCVCVWVLRLEAAINVCMMLL